jgi:uncharacterized protein
MTAPNCPEDCPESRSEHLEQLRRWFDPWSSAIVAYSGGVDSALVAAVAHQQLGDKSLACIGVSPSYPQRERDHAVRQAEQLGMAYRLIDTQEHLDDDYAANRPDRCFFCKDELYGRLRRIAEDEDWALIADGTNAGDLGDVRPGRRAAGAHEVRSPLVELGFTKPLVRQAAKALGLAAWDKPAMACLSSRVPHGTPITPQMLQQIERAEDVLVEQGFTQFRVRYHGQVARIELPAQDLARAVACRDAVVAGIRNAGFGFVCLDLGGFRSAPTPPPSGRGPG